MKVSIELPSYFNLENADGVVNSVLETCPDVRVEMKRMDWGDNGLKVVIQSDNLRCLEVASGVAFSAIRLRMRKVYQ